ncbi:MAG: hypothetical protein NVS4B11_12230 [Ktedonobacteraceae bacterium]
MYICREEGPNDALYMLNIREPLEYRQANKKRRQTLTIRVKIVYY